MRGLLLPALGRIVGFSAIYLAFDPPPLPRFPLIGWSLGVVWIIVSPPERPTSAKAELRFSQYQTYACRLTEFGTEFYTEALLFHSYLSSE